MLRGKYSLVERRTCVPVFPLTYTGLGLQLPFNALRADDMHANVMPELVWDNCKQFQASRQSLGLIDKHNRVWHYQLTSSNGLIRPSRLSRLVVFACQACLLLCKLTDWPARSSKLADSDRAAVVFQADRLKAFSLSSGADRRMKSSLDAPRTWRLRWPQPRRLPAKGLYRSKVDAAG